MNQGEDPNMNPAVWRIRGSRGPGGSRTSSSGGEAAGGAETRSNVAIFTSDGRTPSRCSARLLGLRGRRLALQVSQRQRVPGRAFERPRDRHAEIAVDVQELARLKGTPARILIHRLAG